MNTTAAAFLALWLASAGPLRGLIKALPFPWVVDQVTGIRHPSLIAGLAVLPSGIQTWNWKDRPYPEPVLEALREGIPQGMTLSQRESVIPIYEAGSGREYASVIQDGQGRTICEATGHGGDIDVACATPKAGVLTVKENRWSGWHAEVDGKRSQLLAGQWLAVNLPAGEHLVRFRYRPWDVPLGLAITLMGAILALYLGIRPERKAQRGRGNDG